MKNWNFNDIDILFHPRSVAVVGASRKPNNQGRMFLESMKNPKFKGELYAIHPTDKVEGYKSYRSLLEVPGPVDHAILSVPAAVAVKVIEDCAAKGVRSAALFTSGFAEEGTADGRELQRVLAETARKGNVRIIGPNCMGFYCPKSGLSFRMDHPMREGGIGFIAQSGGVCMTGIFIAEEKKMGFSKAISYGNESDVSAAELLYYFAHDPETETIMIYVEGTKDGREFFEALKYAASRKPVAMLKGGITEFGNKAVGSHTGALAGSGKMWEVAAKQAGAPIVPSMDELFDTALIYTRFKKPAGNRVCLITISGGLGVFSTDVLASADLATPQFDAATTKTMNDLIKRPGTSVGNPVDMATTFFHLKKYPQLFGALDSDANTDMFVMLLAAEYLTYMEEEMQGWSNILVSNLITYFKNLKKPVAVVFFQTVLPTKRTELERLFSDAGIPVFPTIERCAAAIRRKLDY